jgi:hypothetical protein
VDDVPVTLLAGFMDEEIHVSQKWSLKSWPAMFMLAA